MLEEQPLSKKGDSSFSWALHIAQRHMTTQNLLKITHLSTVI